MKAPAAESRLARVAHTGFDSLRPPESRGVRRVGNIQASRPGVVHRWSPPFARVDVTVDVTLRASMLVQDAENAGSNQGR